jgi:hypothetical protein
MRVRREIASNVQVKNGYNFCHYSITVGLAKQGKGGNFSESEKKPNYVKK